jgi:hypothetical protein
MGTREPGSGRSHRTKNYLYTAIRVASSWARKRGCASADGCSRGTSMTPALAPPAFTPAPDRRALRRFPSSQPGASRQSSARVRSVASLHALPRQMHCTDPHTLSHERRALRSAAPSPRGHHQGMRGLVPRTRARVCVAISRLRPDGPPRVSARSGRRLSALDPPA